MHDLAWWVQNFKESAFRLETLQTYTVPQEAELLERWRRAQHVRLPDDHPWLQRVRQHTGAGRLMQRVRVISHPFSSYLKFELSMYWQTVAAGEDIRIAEATPTLLALGDFWLFDNQAVFMMEYDQEGRFLGSSQVLEPLNIYRQMKHLALSSSTPYLEFATRRAG